LRFELITRGFLKSLRKYDEKYGHLNKQGQIKNVKFGDSESKKIK